MRKSRTSTRRVPAVLALLTLPSATGFSSAWTSSSALRSAVRQQHQHQLQQQEQQRHQHHQPPSPPVAPSPVVARRSRVVAGAAKKTAEPVQEIPLDDVIAEVEVVRAAAMEAIAAADDEKALNDARVKYLGKKGSVQAFMAMMRSLSNEDKPKLGAVVNAAKEEVETLIASRKDAMEGEALGAQLAEEYVDVSIDGLPLGGMTTGHRHPLSLTTEKATNIFRALGYDVITGAEESPEMEEDYYCFTALNCPLDHPARDMQDTFYIEDSVDDDGNARLLRTHTSAVQIREMEKRVKANDIPFRIVAPGRVYRKDEIDATHSPVFHQIEILALDEKGKLSVNHLKGTIEYFLRQMFGDEIDVRYRGSYFPFTEPSMEVDVFYKGRWLEVLGCGMVDPRVLKLAGVDPEKYGGFAAGFGVERFAMVTYGIPDIRLFYNSDLRFLEQFPHSGFELGDDVPLKGLTAKAGDDSEGSKAMTPADLFLGQDTAPLAAEPEFEVKDKVGEGFLDEEEGEGGEVLDDGAADAQEEEEEEEEEAMYPLEGMESDWEASFALLEQFKAEHGHTEVPWDYALPAAKEGGAADEEGGRALQRWVATQRRIFDMRDLRQPYLDRLNAVSFDWGNSIALGAGTGSD